MTNTKKTLTKYFIWTFTISWILQIIGSYLAIQGNATGFRAFLSLAMFAPLLGALLAKAPLRDIGWKPKFKGNIRYILAALFLPAVFTILGAVLYFVIFPDRLDFTGKYVIATYGQEMMDQLAAAGLTLPMYLVVGTVQSVTLGPIINMFFALGEEAGWRGIMSPMLKEQLGRTKGLIVGGIIWGAWHWPSMILAGYEYGKGYWGDPFLGMALFCLATTVWGILLDYIYEKSHCIWIPSLAHGAMNAIATLPVMVLEPEYANQLTVGPAPMGIISLIPALVLCIWVLYIGNRNK